MDVISIIKHQDIFMVVIFLSLAVHFALTYDAVQVMTEAFRFSA